MTMISSFIRSAITQLRPVPQPLANNGRELHVHVLPKPLHDAPDHSKAFAEHRSWRLSPFCRASCLSKKRIFSASFSWTVYDRSLLRSDWRATPQSTDVVSI